MSRLTQTEFEATFDDDVEVADEDYNPCLDFWDYVDALSEEDRDGFQHQFTVEFLFYNPVRMIEHVMLRTDTEHVYIVLVLDMQQKAVLGHHNFYCDPNMPEGSGFEMMPASATLWT
jgi:hypothetical protein